MPSRDDADSALAPPVARTGDDRRDPYGWIAEPTAELIDLLDAERAYYEARTAPLAGLRATLAAEMAARVPDTSESAPWRSGGLHLPRSPRGGGRIPHPGAAHRRRSGRIGDRPANGRRRSSRCRVSPRRARGEPRRTNAGLVVRRRRRRAVRPAVPRPADRCGPARCHRGDLPQWRVERGCDDVSVSAHRPLSIDRTRCGRTRWAPIPRRTYWSSPNPTSGSRSASTSPARGRGS